MTTPSKQRQLGENPTDLIILIATLCDAIRRLEYAIKSDGDDRSYYIEQATKKRRYVEKRILSAPFAKEPS